jgi:hypothetical protein
MERFARRLARKMVGSAPTVPVLLSDDIFVGSMGIRKALAAISAAALAMALLLVSLIDGEPCGKSP